MNEDDGPLHILFVNRQLRIDLHSVIAHDSQSRQTIARLFSKPIVKGYRSVYWIFSRTIFFALILSKSFVFAVCLASISSCDSSYLLDIWLQSYLSSAKFSFLLLLHPGSLASSLDFCQRYGEFLCSSLPQTRKFSPYYSMCKCLIIWHFSRTFLYLRHCWRRRN